jgi:hypothetical protein
MCYKIHSFLILPCSSTLIIKLNPHSLGAIVEKAIFFKGYIWINCLITYKIYIVRL